MLGKGEPNASGPQPGLQLIVARKKLSMARDFHATVPGHVQLSLILTTPWSEQRNPDHARVREILPGSTAWPEKSVH
jgi:hypothetical protein